MKKLLLFVLLIPTLALSQVSSWRSGASSPRVSTPSIQQSIPQRNDVSRWRDESPREFNRTKRTRP